MLVDKFDGSRLCDFNFRVIGVEEECFCIVFEVVYWDISFVFINSISCNMKFWCDVIGFGMFVGNKRLLD